MVISDALRVKICDDEVMVRDKAAYLALGVDCDDHEDIPSLWLEQTEGAGTWLRVMTEFKGRSVEAVVTTLGDGLVGFSEALTGRVRRVVDFRMGLA